jgi:hypothetical protein
MDRSLPFNIDAERHVLGACLLERDAITQVFKIVGMPDFMLEKHAHIYEAMLDCVARKEPSDIALVSEELRRRGRLQQVGGIGFLGELVSEVPTALHVEHYARIVARLAARRRVIEKAGRLMADAWDESTPLDEVISNFGEELKIERRITEGNERWQASARDGLQLWKTHFERKPFIVEDILPMGTTLLHGKPKSKKSWLALNFAYAVAAGGKALGHFQAMRGDVLYIDLEMSDDIINERLHVVFPKEPPPKGVTFATDWPSVGHGFEEQLQSYLEARPFTRLVIVDTMVRVRPGRTRADVMYEQDASFVQPLTDFCADKGFALLLIHHSRKAAGLDAVDGASGSTGLTGSVDNVIQLERLIAEKGRATLKLEGRRIRRDDDIPLRWDPMLAQWNYIEDTARMTPERRAALMFLNQRPGISTKDLATLMNRPAPGTSRLLSEMKAAGLVSNQQGGWFAEGPDEPMMA